MPRLIPLLVLLLTLVACAAPSPLPPTPTAALPPEPASAPASPPCLARGPLPPRLAGLRYGVNAFLLGDDPPRVLTLAETAGFGWVRQQIHWRDIEGRRGEFVWAPLDHAVAGARARGFDVLLSVVRAAPWADPAEGLPDDTAAFGGFMATLAERYRGQVSAYEVWNEPNLAVENGGVPGTPADYLAALAAAYPAIKKADPCALVVSAPLAATSVDDPALATPDLPFLEELYRLEGGAFLRLADLVGVHPGGGPFPPDAIWPAERPEESARYFRHIERIRTIMERHRDPRQVWITEVGWAVTVAPGAPPPVSEAEQADYLRHALRLTRESYPWVSAIFVWNLNFAVQGSPDDEKSTFGLLAPDWSPRPAYLALQNEMQRLAEQAARAQPTLRGEPPVAPGWVATVTGKSRTVPLLGPDGMVYVGSDPGWLYAYEPDGAERWRIRLPGGVRSAPALGPDGTLYVLDDGGTLTALDGSGASRWQHDLGEGARGSPLLLGDAVYAAVDDSVARLDLAGRELWRAKLGSTANGLAARPDSAEPAIFATTDGGAVVALSADGLERWRFELGRPVAAAPALAGDAILVGDADGTLHAHDASTGAPRWSRALVRRVLTEAVGPDTPLIAAPPLVTTGGAVYLSGRDGSVSALGQDGRLRWRFDSGSDLNAAPALLSDGGIAVGALDERVIGLDQGGRLQWEAKLNGSVRSTPLQAPDGTLYVTTLAGQLYALSPLGTADRVPWQRYT